MMFSLTGEQTFIPEVSLISNSGWTEWSVIQEVIARRLNFMSSNTLVYLTKKL